jgi:hypothetical protein
LNPVDVLLSVLKTLSSFSKLNDLNYLLPARKQVFMAVAAVMEAHAITGILPDHLPGKFTDPYSDGHLLKYRREGKTGFVVYSVGPSGKFDGGKPGEHHWVPFEVARRYPAPPPEPVPPYMLK